MENIFTLHGTLYSKECRKVKNTKKPTEPDWEFYSIKIETKLSVGGRTFTSIPEVHLDKGVSSEGFEVGDKILADCFLFGKAINSTWYKTDCKAISLRFAPLENGDIRQPRKKDNGGMPPPPSEKAQEDNGDFGDLPF